MNNILLIPGSFNPITNAHIEMAKTAQKAVNAETVYFIPAHDTYVARKRTLISGKSRCRLIDEATPCNMTSIPTEVNSFLPKKTYDTVQEIKACFDKNLYNFYICLGMDNIATLITWYRWEALIKENMIIACRRENENLEETLKISNLEQYKNYFKEIIIPKNHISSSLVRELCEQGRFDEVEELVPKNVCEYLRRFYSVIDGI